MGKPKHQRGMLDEETFVNLASSVRDGSFQLYDVWRDVSMEEAIIVAGVNPFRVTSIRDNHQQVHVLSEVQDKE